MELHLREIVEDDHPFLYENEADPIAIQMAAFTSRNMPDREVYDARMQRIKDDPDAIMKAIVFEHQVIGCVGSYKLEGQREMTYWISRSHWGKGIATAALRLHLNEIQERPVYATAAADNQGSIRVLEKCGFKPCGRDTAFANARNQEIEELYFRLD